ncbi:MAG: hypothetical protein ACTHN5_08025 [Phycisphaerae bacterium]
MNSPSAPISSTPAVISYQTAAPPLLLHPVLASCGFTLFALALIADFGLRLSRFLHLPVPRPFAFSIDLYSHLLMIAGALFVVHAFRRSPLAPGAFRISLFAAIWAYAVAYALSAFFLTHRGWVFYTPHSSTSPLGIYAMLVLQDATLAAMLLLWLVLLWRIGRAVGSPLFCILSAITLSARILLVLLWTALSICYALAMTGGTLFLGLIPDNIAPLSRYADLLSAPLMSLLAIWCIFLPGPLAKIPHRAQPQP